MINAIGIVGGVGPYAGLELQRAILHHSQAHRDQDYPPVVSISNPEAIADRSQFLLGDSSVNPAYEIITQIKILYSCGARYIGIPCNTAHADKIFSVVQMGIKELHDAVLVNMLDETFRSVKSNYPEKVKVGVLATKGSYKSNLFSVYGKDYSFEIVIPPDDALRDALHRSIYDERYGIKALGYLHEYAKMRIDGVLDYMMENQVDVVILGCTELSVVFKEDVYRNLSLISPIDILAKKLIALQRRDENSMSH
jgi:aspartate racemase